MGSESLTRTFIHLGGGSGVCFRVGKFSLDDSVSVEPISFDRRTCTVDGHRLAVLDGRGDNNRPAVVFLHGITLSVNFWPAAMRAKWLADLPWISLSLPGHYPSEVPKTFRAEHVTPEWFAQLIGGVLEEFTADQPVHLIGWSTGGFAALCTAALRPERIASVACISGYADGHWTGTMGWLQRIAGWGEGGPAVFRRLLEGSRRSRWIFDQTLLQAAGNRATARRFERWEPTIAALYDDYCRHDIDVLCTLFRRLRDMDAHDAFSRISCPALIVGGTVDPFIPSTATRRLAAAIPNAELVMLDDIGHLFFAECPERTEQLLTAWLSRANESISRIV